MTSVTAITSRAVSVSACNFDRGRTQSPLSAIGPRRTLAIIASVIAKRKNWGPIERHQLASSGCTHYSRIPKRGAWILSNFRSRQRSAQVGNVNYAVLFENSRVCNGIRRPVIQQELNIVVARPFDRYNIFYEAFVLRKARAFEDIGRNRNYVGRSGAPRMHIFWLAGTQCRRERRNRSRSIFRWRAYHDQQ
ncbi:hypothetical protein HYPP_02702 [Hyphomicrobium sp. ghe19]|nr:hypothetical protein HYPP_02702 [Hyphomicrobium sp. ghe19]